MKLKIIIHEAEEGGFWAEVPAVPGQNLRITVPVHGNQDLKQGVQKAIMRLVGIHDDEL